MESLVATFLAAFENLDMPAFIACFAEDATMFLPSPEPCERFRGRAAIEDRFARVFARIRAQAPDGPPFHRLVAEDLLVQQLTPGAGLVSFHLRSTERVAGRSLIMLHSSAGWRIQHLHASNAPLPSAATNGA